MTTALPILLVPCIGQASTSQDEADRQTERAKKCAQDYPEEARRNGKTGTTKVRISVDAEGNATDVVVAGNSGWSKEHRQLDRAAVALFKCIAQYRKTGAPYSFEAEYVWRLD
jgi:TonB family protein